MNTVAAIPSSRAAHASAWPWLPALAAITPAARSASPSPVSLLTAPRILNEPVRCRFSAFSHTLVPAMRESVSEPCTGVTRARPASRSRAASISASVGAVAVANSEHLLQDLTNRRQRVELPGLHVVEKAPQLRALAHRVLEVLASACRGDGEHLGGEIAPAAGLELALRLEPRAVLADLLPQRVDSLAAQRLGENDRRPPPVLRPERKHLAHLVQHRFRERVVELVDRDHVGDLHDPGLQRLDGVARARHEREHDGVAIESTPTSLCPVPTVSMK